MVNGLSMIEVFRLREENRTRAKKAVEELKSCVLRELQLSPAGLRNVDIGRQLGIYGGHKGHEGHVSRTLLASLEQEGKVHQDKESKIWTAIT